MVNQLCLKCTLTLHWHAQLKGAANRPGMHPVTLPLPTTVEVSKRLAGLIIGSGKYTTTVRLLKYTSGLATPIPANLPRLVDSGWSALGEETPTMKNINRMIRGDRGRRPQAPPRPASMKTLRLIEWGQVQCTNHYTKSIKVTIDLCGTGKCQRLVWCRRISKNCVEQATKMMNWLQTK